jgi:hypothetical protein
VLFTSLGAQLADRLPDQLPSDVRQQVVDLVVDSAGAAIPGLEAQSPDAAAAARDAFSEATRAATFTAAGFLVVGLLATLSLGASAAGDRRSRSREDTPASSAP